MTGGGPGSGPGEAPVGPAPVEPASAAAVRGQRPRLPPLRRQLRGLLLSAALAVVVSVAAIAISARLRPASLLDVGSRAPAVDLLGPGPTHGDAVATARGRPLVVEFFEAGCAVCQQTAPQICRVLAARPALTVVAVDAALEPMSAVGGFARDHLAACAGDPRLALYADPCRPPGGSPCHNVSERWKVRFVPTVYLVDGDGTIVYAASGVDAYAGIDSALDRFAGPPSSRGGAGG